MLKKLKKKISKHIIKNFILACIIILACLVLSERITNERKNNNVEISLSFEEVFDLCSFYNYDLSDFLKRAEAIGITSVSINEETLNSLSFSGKIAFYSNGEYKRLQLIELLAPYSKINGDTIVILDNSFTDLLLSQLSKRYNITAVPDSAGKYRVISIKFNSSYRPVYWSENMPLGFSPEKIKQISDLGLKVVLKPINSGNPEWLPDYFSDKVSGIIWEGKEVPGYPGREKETIELLRKSGVKLFNLEFTKISGADKINRQLPAHVICGHTIPIDEMYQNTDDNITRWMRSVNERGNRYLYFHFYRNKSIEDNVSYLRSLARELKKENYELSNAVSPGYPLGKLIHVRKYLIFLIAIIFPVLAIANRNRFSSVIASYFAINAVTLSGALLIAVLIYDLMFMQKILLPLSVKLSMVLPLLICIFILYSRKDIELFLNYELKIKHLAGAGAVLAILGVMLIRSGNNSSAILPFEPQLRQLLENILSIRPRTKEFLIGQPLLLAGLHFKKRYLILFGTIGQVSIINTFMHAHSPLTVSLVRVFNGLWLGFLLGFILISIIELARNVSFRTEETR
jgi:hypothetical protein